MARVPVYYTRGVCPTLTRSVSNTPHEHLTRMMTGSQESDRKTVSDETVSDSLEGDKRVSDSLEADAKVSDPVKGDKRVSDSLNVWVGRQLKNSAALTWS